ncbi:MAG TPA: alpha/beta fold hydrolase [Ilumatobacter sp.]
MSATPEPVPGPAARPVDRLVFLHGFTQTHHHWHRVAHLVARRLPASPELVFVDLPGHGSGSLDRTGIAASGPALAELARRGTFVGYSMGARFALLAALARPRLVERLVVIGGTPGIGDPAERAARLAADHALAERVEAIGVDAFLAEWLAAPMFAGLPPDPDDLRHRRRNTAAGLAHSLRTCGTAAQGDLWPRLDELTMPVLVLAGELDDKFTGIGRQMAERLPRGTFAAVPGAGHAAHSERPEATADLVAAWLAATG